MKISKLLMFAVCLVSLISFVYATNYVVISELGVNPYYGIDFTNDGKEFIELYNPTNSTVDISNWYISFKGMASTLDVVIPSGSFIQRNGYYLIGDTGGNGWPSTWSKPNLFDNFQLTNTNFGIKLLNSFDDVVDAVGWGSLIGYPDYYETQPLDNPIKGYFERKPSYTSPSCGNWQDTNNNSNDFLDNSNPSPQNSSFTEQPCDDVVQCIDNSDCNDGLFCNGAETCNMVTFTCVAGTIPNCADSVSCTTDSCNEATDSCVHTVNNALCSDNLFCNGVETCDALLGCQSGTSVNCADNIGCTVDSCNEASDSCVYTANNALCSDGVYCNGAEVCNPLLGCQSGNIVDCSANSFVGISTCANNPDNNPFTWDYREAFNSICDEVNDRCPTGNSSIRYTCSIQNCGAECESDIDCSDGYICNLASCDCILSGEPYCGDGIKNENEECDGQDFGSLSCISFGYNDGSLVCAAGCLISTDNCFNIAADTDTDGIADSIDNCINIANPDQQDSDNDEIGNVCDDCPNDAQNDIDEDGICGDMDYCPNDAQNDIDEDEYCANFDNCATVYNGNQLNSDNDIMGDACDNCPNDAKNDIDQDEICGDVDYLTGGYSTIKLNVPCFSFSVNDETNLNNFIGLGHVVIKECNDTMPLVEFDFNFGVYYLGLIDAIINTTSDGSGILVSNINLTDRNTTKTVYINRALSTDTICVIDSEIASLSVSGDCSNGVKLNCNGSAGGYTCEKIENNTMYKITGLRHSAVMEYSYSAPQNNNNDGGGGGGGGGGSRGIVRNITPIATTSIVTIKPTPKKPAEAKPTPAETTSQEVAETIATEEITPSEILETVEKEGNFITGAIVAATSTVMGMLKNSRILRNIIIALAVLVIVFIVIYFSVNKYLSVNNKKKSKKSRKGNR